MASRRGRRGTKGKRIEVKREPVRQTEIYWQGTGDWAVSLREDRHELQFHKNVYMQFVLGMKGGYMLRFGPKEFRAEFLATTQFDVSHAPSLFALNR